MADWLAAAQIGFIGLGQMGMPMVRRMLHAGRSLHVHDVRAEAVAELVAEGARACPNLYDMARTCDVIFACLPSVAVYRQLVDLMADMPATLPKEGGGAMRQPPVFVHLGTTGVQCALDLAAAVATWGGVMLDAPVTGGPQRGVNGTLTSMVAGPPAVVERCRKLLEDYSSVVIHVSDRQGAAQVMKSINGMVSRTNLMIGCEALAMGARTGIAPAVVLEVLNHGTGQNDATLHKLPLALRGQDFGATLAIVAKDLAIWQDDVDRLNCTNPVGRAAAGVYANLFERLGPDEDLLSIVEQVVGAGFKPARTA